MAGTRGFSPAEDAATREQVTHEVELAAAAAEAVVRRQRAASAAGGDGPGASALRGGAGRGGAGGGGVAVPPFTHLTVRTCWSLRDGAIRPRELTAAAAAAGMTHVAVTDRDGLYGAVRFAQAAAADGVVPVFGTDLALAASMGRPGWEISRAGRQRLSVAERGKVAAHDPRARGGGRGPGWLEDDAARVVLLARTTAGYGDLCRTVSAAHLGGAVAQARAEETGRVTGDGRVLDAARSSPHLAWEDVSLAVARAGSFVLLGSESPVARLLARGQGDAAEAEARRWLEVAGTDALLLGVRDHLVKRRRVPGPQGEEVDGCDDTTLVRRTLDLAQRLGVRAVATNDVRHLTRDDVLLGDVLACIRAQAPLGSQALRRASAQACFTTAAEQAARFRERPDLLRAAHDVALACDVDLGLGEVHVPRLTGMADEVACGELHRRSWQGVAQRFPRVTPRVRERLERELAMIDRLGLWDYFLTVADIVADIRAQGIIAACRGSAAGSLICYALRISDVDPVAHDLAFERFMNPYRDELPDIDIDVESARREDVYELVLQRYGGDRTACVAMVETLQARSGIREVGKALGLPTEELGAVAKAFTHARARDVRGAIARLPELQRANLDAGQLDLLFDVVERLDGFPRHLALHPCGILLADVRLTDRTPLEQSAAGWPMSQFDKDDIAALGLLKLDVLSVRMLSSMRHALDLLPHTRGQSLEFADIPAEDPQTYDLIRSARSIGMFQIESPGQRELLGRLQPDHFGDLITEISLFRPGPVKADMVTPFVARRRGDEAAVYAHPSIEPILRETHGVVVYHEQVMACLCALTGCDMSYADLLRRKLSDRDAAPRLKVWAFARARERGFSDVECEAVWKQVAAFASFGFCKAHAAAFAVPTYRSAWLKTHAFPEFMAGLLTHDPGMYPRRLILDECRMFGVAVLPPDVNRSESDYTVEVVDRGLADHLLGLRRVAPGAAAAAGGGGAGRGGAGRGGAGRGDGAGRGVVAGWHVPPGWTVADDTPVPPSGRDAGEAGGGYRYAVRVGFQDVKGITAEEIDALVSGRPYTSLQDFRARSKVSRPIAERLVMVGALDMVAGVGRPGGPRHRRHVLLGVEELWAGVKGRRRAGLAADGSTAVAEQTAMDIHADHEAQLPEPTGAEQVRDELAVLGMDVSRHVLSFYEPLLDALGVVRAAELGSVPEWRRVRVAGVKVAVQSPQQRSGQRVLFLSLDDRTGASQSTFFERTLPDVAWTCLHAWLLVTEGVVRRRGKLGATVNGQRAWDLSRLWRAWQEGWLADALEETGTPAPHERAPARPEGLIASEFGRGSR